MAQWEEEYAWEPYETTTTDGYILTVFKIFKRQQDLYDDLESVILQHGYSNDATTIMQSLNFGFPGEKTNPFKIIDEGFILWMGNFRGTRYSLGHETLDNT